MSPPGPSPPLCLTAVTSARGLSGSLFARGDQCRGNSGSCLFWISSGSRRLVKGHQLQPGNVLGPRSKSLPGPWTTSLCLKGVGHVDNPLLRRRSRKRPIFAKVSRGGRRPSSDGGRLHIEQNWPLGTLPPKLKPKRQAKLGGNTGICQIVSERIMTKKSTHGVTRYQ